jgi:hypothetical protein
LPVAIIQREVFQPLTRYISAALLKEVFDHSSISEFEVE